MRTLGTSSENSVCKLAGIAKQTSAVSRFMLGLPLCDTSAFGALLSIVGIMSLVFFPRFPTESLIVCFKNNHISCFLGIISLSIAPTLDNPQTIPTLTREIAPHQPQAWMPRRNTYKTNRRNRTSPPLVEVSQESPTNEPKLPSRAGSGKTVLKIQRMKPNTRGRGDGRS